MIVLVCGGRDYGDYNKICEVLDEMCRRAPTGHIIVLNGGANGADNLATLWAQEHSEKCIQVPVAGDPYGAQLKGVPYDWTTHGKAAGPLRNQYMIDRHKPDRGVVFPGGKGTADMLGRLFYAGVDTWVVGR